MVNNEFKIIYSSNLLTHFHDITKNDEMTLKNYKLEDDEKVILDTLSTDDKIIVNILCHHDINNKNTNVNIFKKAVSFLVISIISAITMDMFDGFDPFEYKTDLIIEIINTELPASIEILIQGNNTINNFEKAKFKVVYINCKEVSKNFTAKINYDASRELINEFMRFNDIRTLARSTIVIILVAIGVVTLNLVTIIFSLLIFAIILLSFVISRRNLKKTWSKIIELDNKNN